MCVCMCFFWGEGEGLCQGWCLCESIMFMKMTDGRRKQLFQFYLSSPTAESMKCV